ncbi:MAG TPA: TIGR04283 family arsenosugar biosynthesis glycosyltransferase [candidate division Zixibacteria bacterium]|nr:TIGR04283 family arsenosugar biosynthesis glycosyltransferase [candidate division Zixibacteria bacterium]
MRVSVIVPVLNEAATIGTTIDDLKGRGFHELIVVDGGSEDGTRRICRQHGIEPVGSRRGRGAQMNEGARRATGDVLLFLHADTRLPETAAADIHRAMSDPTVAGGRFDIRLDASGFLMKLIGAMISWRSRLTRVSTGDQAIFVRREVFAALGGYPDYPLMEDIAFSRALKRTGRIACLKSRVITSARRWEREGVWRTIVKMWALKLLYLSGSSPFRLKRYYEDVR